MMKQLRRSTIVLLLILHFVGISSTSVADEHALHPTLQKSALPELIPTEVFFRDRPTSYFHRISPDGKRLLWVTFTAGRPRIQFRSVDGGEAQTLNTRAPGALIQWARDSRRIIFLRDKDGDENHHLYVVDTERPKTPEKDLTPFDRVKVWWHQIFPDDPSHLLILMNQRDRTLFDLYRVNIETGALELIAENPGDVLQWITDVKGRTVARYRRLASGEWILEVPSEEEGKWRTLITGTFEESHSFQGHPIDGTSMLALSNVGRDRTSLVRIDLNNGRETVLYSNPKVDLDQLWVDDETYMPIRASAWPGYWDFYYFDEEIGADVAVFQQNEPTVVRVPSADRSKTVMIVNVTTDRSGTSVYLYDRKTKTKSLLASPPIAKYAEMLSKTKPVSFRSRDGLELNGYLTIPNGTAGKNLPMVLKVHGGPWSRDVWGYDADIQFFANRGYAVLQVNYRGSVGYGKEFARGIKREFAGKAHDDLIDGVNWAIKEGVADPAKIAVYGRSYGGYATLVGLTFTPEVFAAGIDVVGVSDLVTTLKNFPPYWKLWIHRWHNFVGNPDDPKDERDLAARSPINFIDRIKRPLLVAQGANDVRVIRENSDRLVQEMKKRDLSVEYVLFDDEGHRIVKNNNRLMLAQRMEAFLSKHLGGRQMPIKE
jgi:dipeptidyl aminopeptidase/acylaminoacyl peptidase